MAPVLSSGNYDYDYDTVQPYFLDGEEEDFYLPPRSQLLPGPSEDIWKKFELLPTPPLSPSRRPSLSAAEHLEAVSDLLDEECNPSAALLQSFIIQDCMWSSSFAAATELERVVSQRLASLQTRQASSTATSGTTTPEGSADQQVGSSQANTRCLQDLYSTAAECVDPSVVFPHSTLTGDGAAASELSLDSPPLSSSDSESGEEEGEEVDVVTVDRRKAGHRPDASPLVLKRSHINVHQHNYAAHQPAASKRLKSQSGQRCCSPRSDEEDGGDRRRTHNVLERQRRSELRMSFLALRDQIPAVADNDKTAKVVILKKATELIWQMREDERTLLRTKDELKKRSRELRHRLEQLKTSL